MRPRISSSCSSRLLGGDPALLGELADLRGGDVARLLQTRLHERVVDILELYGETRCGDRLGDLAAHGAGAHDGGLEHEHVAVPSVGEGQRSGARPRFPAVGGPALSWARSRRAVARRSGAGAARRGRCRAPGGPGRSPRRRRPSQRSARRSSPARARRRSHAIRRARSVTSATASRSLAAGLAGRAALDGLVGERHLADAKRLQRDPDLAVQAQHAQPALDLVRRGARERQRGGGEPQCHRRVGRKRRSRRSSRAPPRSRAARAGRRDARGAARPRPAPRRVAPRARPCAPFRRRGARSGRCRPPPRAPRRRRAGSARCGSLLASSRSSSSSSTSTLGRVVLALDRQHARGHVVGACVGALGDALEQRGRARVQGRARRARRRAARRRTARSRRAPR